MLPSTFHVAVESELKKKICDGKKNEVRRKLEVESEHEISIKIIFGSL